MPAYFGMSTPPSAATYRRVQLFYFPEGPISRLPISARVGLLQPWPIYAPKCRISPQGPILLFPISARLHLLRPSPTRARKCCIYQKGPM